MLIAGLLIATLLIPAAVIVAAVVLEAFGKDGADKAAMFAAVWYTTVLVLAGCAYIIDTLMSIRNMG